MNSQGSIRADRTKERVAEYFDQDPAGYADTYSHLDTASAFSFRKRRQAIVMGILRSLKGGLILDVGCGPGIYAKPCVEQGFQYYGIDLSGQMINEARRIFGSLTNAEFGVGDAQHLPLPSNSVDGLLCLGMLEYVCREQEVAYLNEMARVLKPGGTIIFSFLNASSPYWIWIEYFLPPITFLLVNLKAIVSKSKYVSFKDCLGEELPTRKFRPGERTKLLQAVGLSFRKKIYFSRNIFPSRGVPRQMVWVSSKVEHLLQTPLLKWLGMGFVIIAHKSAETDCKQKVRFK
jgi:ubiquinone/menaquinone biosynthesis C-methylase UbiE